MQINNRYDHNKGEHKKCFADIQGGPSINNSSENEGRPTRVKVIGLYMERMADHSLSKRCFLTLLTSCNGVMGEKLSHLC